MIHQFQGKKRIVKKKRIIRIIIIVIVFLALFSSLFIFSSQLTNYIGLPIWKAKNTLINKTEEFNYLSRSKSSIWEENQELLRKIYDLEIRMVDYNIIKRENEDLKEILNSVPKNKDLVLAEILVKPSYSPYDTLIINVGKRDNIVENSKVYVNGIIPVGTVSEVFDKTSRVELFSNPGRVTVATLEDTNENVELIGRGGSNFEMLVPLEVNTTKGTHVTLPGFISEIVAVIEKEISSPTDPVKKVILHSPVNIQNQKWVQVEK